MESTDCFLVTGVGVASEVDGLDISSSSRSSGGNKDFVGVDCVFLCDHQVLRLVYFLFGFVVALPLPEMELDDDGCNLQTSGMCTKMESSLTHSGFTTRNLSVILSCCFGAIHNRYR